MSTTTRTISIDYWPGSRILEGFGPDDLGEITYEHFNAILHPVRNQGRSYDPPTTHLGKPWTENNALAVARAVLAYMEGVIAEGEAYVVDRSS